MPKQDETSALQRRLAQLPARQRLDALLSAPDARALVQSTPAEDLYFAIAEVGLADATELVQLASPEQFQTFVDLGGWKRDQVEPHQLLTWLRAARGDETDEFLAKVGGLDLELIEVLLRELTVIHDREENPDVHPEGVTLEMPEGKYLIEFKVDGVELFALKTLLNDLISQNPFEAGRLVEAVRWELPSELEETAYQFRSARLADLGFPELEVAMGLFSYVDPARVERMPARATPDAAALAPSRGGLDYLQAGLQGLKAEEQERLEGQLRYLVNAALVAEAAEPGDLDAVRSVSERARDYLLLGLEFLTHGQPAAAVDVLRGTPVQRVFQVGFSLTLQLKFKADRLMRQPLARVGGVAWVLEPERTALEALRRKRPLKALKVEGAEPVPFRTLKELAEAEAVLGRVAEQLALFAALLGPTPEVARERVAALKEDAEPPSPERTLMAALVHAVLDGGLRAAPVPEQRLQELGQRLFEGRPDAPALQAAAVARVHGALTALLQGEAARRQASLADRLLEQLRVELGPAFLTSGTLGASEASALLPLLPAPTL